MTERMQFGISVRHRDGKAGRPATYPNCGTFHYTDYPDKTAEPRMEARFKPKAGAGIIRKIRRILRAKSEPPPDEKGRRSAL